MIAIMVAAGGGFFAGVVTMIGGFRHRLHHHLEGRPRMNVGKFMVKALGWAWKKALRPTLEERAAQIAIDALNRRRRAATPPNEAPQGDS